MSVSTEFIIAFVMSFISILVTIISMIVSGIYFKKKMAKNNIL